MPPPSRRSFLFERLDIVQGPLFSSGHHLKAVRFHFWAITVQRVQQERDEEIAKESISQHGTPCYPVTASDDLNKRALRNELREIPRKARSKDATEVPSCERTSFNGATTLVHFAESILRAWQR